MFVFYLTLYKTIPTNRNCHLYHKRTSFCEWLSKQSVLTKFVSLISTEWRLRKNCDFGFEMQSQPHLKWYLDGCPFFNSSSKNVWYLFRYVAISRPKKFDLSHVTIFTFLRISNIETQDFIGMQYEIWIYEQPICCDWKCYLFVFEYIYV